MLHKYFKPDKFIYNKHIAENLRTSNWHSKNFLLLIKSLEKGKRGKKELCSKQKPNRIISTTSFMPFKFFKKIKKQRKNVWSDVNIFDWESENLGFSSSSIIRLQCKP